MPTLTLDLREVDSIELITRKTESSQLIVMLRKGKKPWKSYEIPIEEWYRTKHDDTVRMRVTFRAKKGFWRKFKGKVTPIELNITLLRLG
jgi:hypothetical protein